MRQSFIVIGAGLGGLAAALFLARRGGRVILLEKDGGDPPGPGQDCFDPWSRRGVVQMRQPHVILGRGALILEREAPDVLEDLEAAGAQVLTADGARPAPQSNRPFALCARRPLLEAAFRRAALAEPGVTFLKGCEAVGLLAVPAAGGDPPRIVGVRLADGATVHADLVVDAAGRWAPTARWLAAAGADPVSEAGQPLEFHSVTRWYRYGAGARTPARAPMRRASAGYAVFSAFAADRDTFALSVMVSLRDPRRAELRDPEAFDRVVRASRLLRPWARSCHAISDPLVLSRVENRSVRLVRDGRPVVAGLVLLGDSAVHTTPTLGLGASLALLMAERVAHQAGRAAAGTPGFVGAYEAWRDHVVEPWFRAQVDADALTLREMRRTLARLPGPCPLSPRERFFRAAELEAGVDEELAAVLEELRHMITPPDEVARNPLVQSRVARRLRRRRPLEGGLREMDRAAFENALLGRDAACGIRMAV